MYDYHYRVCGLDLRVTAPQALWTEPPSDRFEAPAAPEPDLRFRLSPVPEIETPPGIFRGRNRERAVWQDGQRVFRRCQDMFRTRPHICTSYRLDKPGEADCAVREADWLWATRSQFLWSGIMLNHLLLHFRAMVFHASYIEHGGRAILFTAPSGTGKSTQAELWRVHRGAEVLNGDKAAVRLAGAPMACGLPFCGTSGICVHRDVPLRAIVTLAQAPDNTVRRLPPSQAVAALCPNVFTDRYIPEEWQLTLGLLLDLVSAVPVWALACTPDVRAVEALERALEGAGEPV